MRDLKWTLVALAALALLAAPQTATAESHEEAPAAPPLFMVHFDQVNPSKVMEYEANGKQWVEAFKAAKMGPEWTWYAYSNASFVYGYVFPVPNYGFLDGQDAREKAMAAALGEEKMAELMKVGEYIDSHYSEMLKAVPELSYQPADSIVTQAGFARVGVHSVKPGMTERFKEMAKRVVADFAKAGAKLGFNAYSVEFGEGSYAFVTFADSAAQFYSQPGTGEILAKAESPEAAQEIYQEWRDCITAYDTQDWAVRADLSYVPTMEAEPEGEEAPAGAQ